MAKGIIDISVGIDESLVVWPGSPSVRFSAIKDMNAGDGVNDTLFSGSVHSGTHIDAPSHYVKGGKSVEALDLDILIGEVYVLYLPDVKEISAEILQNNAHLFSGAKRVLFKTDNSSLWRDGDNSFYEDFVALTEDAAQWVVDNDIWLVGIDYLSIQRFTGQDRVHNILLGAGVVVLETLDLSSVEQGWYKLVCLPVKFNGIEASLTRAILLTQ